MAVKGHRKISPNRLKVAAISSPFCNILNPGPWEIGLKSHREFLFLKICYRGQSELCILVSMPDLETMEQREQSFPSTPKIFPPSILPFPGNSIPSLHLKGAVIFYIKCDKIMCNYFMWNQQQELYNWSGELQSCITSPGSSLLISTGVRGKKVCQVSPP